MKKFLVIFLVIVLTLMLTCSAYAYALIENTYGIDTPPLYFILYSGFEESTITAIHNACITWNNGGVGALVYRSTSGMHNYVPTSLNDYFVKDNTNKIMKGELGDDTDIVAQASWYRERVSIIPLKYKIKEVDIVYNISYPCGNADLYTVYDIESLTLHELGHAIGLADLYGASDTQKVMYGVDYIGRICRSLSQDEKDALEYLY